MGTMKKKLKSRVGKNKASKAANATVNRAGGVAFEIQCPATKLITMTGGSFFSEPRYYNGDSVVAKRGAAGKYSKLAERLRIVREKAKFVDAGDLDDVAQEVIATAVDIMGTENPRDALAIANWLRNEMNIRLTPQVLLVLASAHENCQEYVRQYATKIIRRPDEVKTVVALHKYFFGSKSLKNCLSRGIGDALHKFNERGLMKYDSPGYPTFKDVLRLVRKRKKDYPLPDAVCKYFIKGEVDEEGTPVAFARREMTKQEKFDKKAKELVAKSLANWEVVLSQFGRDDKTKREVWEYLIEKNLVGYMALLRNLRNLMKTDVSSKVIDAVAKKLSDKEEVLRSKQLPFRFTMAYEMLQGFGSQHGYGYGYEDERETIDDSKLKTVLEAIEDAAEAACENVPFLTGETAVFADNSGSMESAVSDRSKMSCKNAANTLAAICAKRSEKSIVAAFATAVAPVSYTKRTSVMEMVKKLANANTNGCSTNGHLCFEYLIRKNAHPDRIILLSDMQCWTDGYGYGYGGSSSNVADAWQRYKRSKQSANTWLHSVNLHGYGDSIVDEKKEKVNLVGGFSEKIIQMLLQTEGVMAEEEIPTIEQIRQKF